MSKIMLALITVLIAFTGVFAYGYDENPTTGQKNQTILVKDGAGPGQDIKVPANPQRVIFLNSSSLDLWVGAGGKDRVAAYAKLRTAPEGLYDALGDVKVLGTTIQISPELILEQKPDLVVGNGINSTQSTLGNVMKQSGIPVLTIANNSLKDTFYELKLYGEMTGRPELAQREITRIKTKIEQIGKTYEKKKKPKVAVIWGTPESFSLLVPDSRQGEFLSLAGGENIVRTSGSSSRYVPISLEYIAKENPDHLFFINMGNRRKMQDALNSLLSDSSSWRTLKAVKENKVHVLPPELFTAHYGLSVDKAIEYMNKLLY